MIFKHDKSKSIGALNSEDLPKASDLKKKMKESDSVTIGDTHNLGAYDGNFVYVI